MSAQRLALHVDHVVLERPEFRGTATRYQRTHLLRLLAIQRLRREGVPTLAVIDLGH